MTTQRDGSTSWPEDISALKEASGPREYLIPDEVQVDHLEKDRELYFVDSFFGKFGNFVGIQKWGSYYIDKDTVMKVDGTTPKCGDLEGAMTKKIHGSCAIYFQAGILWRPRKLVNVSN